MTVWKAIGASYRDGTAFLLACPMLAMIPIGFEILQHTVEVWIGMYDSVAAAGQVENHPARLGFGVLKVLALVATAYGVARFLPRRDSGFAARRDPQAIRLFAGVLAFHAVFAAFNMFAMPRTVAALPALLLVEAVVAALIACWVTAAANGDATVGPRTSVTMMIRHLPFALALWFAVLLPPMILHYALAIPAVIGPKALLWPLLIVDSVVVGWLAALLAAAGYHAAVRAGLAVDRYGRDATTPVAQAAARA